MSGPTLTVTRWAYLRAIKASRVLMTRPFMRRELRPVAPMTGRPYMAWGAGLRSLREAGWIEELKPDLRGSGSPFRAGRVTTLWNVTPAGHKIIETLPDTFRGLPVYDEEAI